MADTFPAPPTPPSPPTPHPATPPLAPVDHAHEHPEAHEHSDVNVRALITALILLGATAVAVHIGMYYLFFVYRSQEAAQPVNLPRTAITAPQPGPPPGVPRIQGVPGYHTPTPRQDMAALRAANEAALSSSGPADQPGFVRIPIDRAMDLALERNLFPARTPPPEGSHTPGDTPTATDTQGAADAEP